MQIQHLKRRVNSSNADCFYQRLGRKIEDIKSSEYGKSEVSGHTTVFHALLNSDLPPKEKSSLRLRDEAFTLLLGGTTTT